MGHNPKEPKNTMDYWVDSKGNVFLINEMKIEHLINAIRKIIRETWKTHYLIPLTIELKRRTEQQSTQSP